MLEVKNSFLGGGRSKQIDSIKGLLIILVIVGHFLPGTLKENFARYFIYSFHMPIFFAVSGYLVNIEKLRNFNFLELLQKYGLRVIVPWLIAVQVYFSFNCVLGFESLTFKHYIVQYIWPFYHLWFVIGYLFCIGCLWTTIKLWKTEDATWLKGLAAISIIMAAISISFPNVLSETLTGKVLNIIDNTLRPQFLMFFSAGIILRKCELNINVWKNIEMCSLMAIIVAALFYTNVSEALLDLVQWIFSFSLILLLYAIRDIPIKEVKILMFCGVNSFPIYLWHIIGKQFALWITGNTYNWIYYVCCFIWIMILLPGIKIINKYSVPKRLFCGC